MAALKEGDIRPRRPIVAPAIPCGMGRFHLSLRASGARPQAARGAPHGSPRWRERAREGGRAHERQQGAQATAAERTRAHCQRFTAAAEGRLL